MRIQRDRTSWQVVHVAGIAPCRFHYRVWVWDADLDVPWLRLDSIRGNLLSLLRTHPRGVGRFAALHTGHSMTARTPPGPVIAVYCMIGWQAAVARATASKSVQSSS